MPRVFSGDTQTPEGQLVEAVENSNVDRVRELLDAGVVPDIMIPDYSEASPLGVAIRNGNIEIAKLLLDHGADINHNDGAGCTPLIDACSQGDLEAVRFLLSRGPDVNAVFLHGTALDEARHLDHFDIEKLLLENGGISERAVEERKPVKDHSDDYGCVLAVAFLAGYGLLLLGRNLAGADADFLKFTSPAVIIIITSVILLRVRQLFRNCVHLFFVSLLYVSLFPLARESTHYDPVQVPLTLAVFALAVAFFVSGLVVCVADAARRRASANQPDATDADKPGQSPNVREAEHDD